MIKRAKSAYPGAHHGDSDARWRKTVVFVGTPNGKWDDSTVNAMRNFQVDHGLNASGKLDAKTLQQLGLGSQTAGSCAAYAAGKISSTRPSAESSSTSKQIKSAVRYADRW